MRTLLVVLCTALFAVPCMAEKPEAMAKSAPLGSTSHHPGNSILAGEFLTEGFEAAVPPAGWTELASTADPYNWYQDAVAPRTGLYDARVEWTASFIQDEELISGPVDLSAAVTTDLNLTFWISTNPYWATNANTEVYLSSDGVTWNLAWDVLTANPASFVYTKMYVDVSAYAGGNLYFKFKYSGTDGADVHIDDVAVGYDAPPPPPVPPLNDTCAGAEANGFSIPPLVPFTLTGDNTLAANDYPLSSGSCTGFSATGKDVVWYVDMFPGWVLTVTMTTSTGWDDSIYLITDCADAQNSCVAGADLFPDGSTFSYTHTGAAARYYLIVSAYASGTGGFTVTGTLDTPVSIESTSWGQVKSSYR